MTWFFLQVQKHTNVSQCYQILTTPGKAGRSGMPTRIPTPAKVRFFFLVVVIRYILQANDKRHDWLLQHRSNWFFWQQNFHSNESDHLVVTYSHDNWVVVDVSSLRPISKWNSFLTWRKLVHLVVDRRELKSTKSPLLHQYKSPTKDLRSNITDFQSSNAQR